MKKTLGLYFHIPFCKSKCAYCNFISFANNAQTNSYLKALLKEIDIVSKDFKDIIVNTVFIGGGTPSYMEEGVIKKLVIKIKENFNLSSNCEITIETNPESITTAKLIEYKEVGINRLSIGLQTSNDRLLKLINRPHTKKQYITAIKLAKQAGLTNINTDIMFSIPTQKFRDIKKTIKLLKKLKLKHISAYDLILEEGTPLYGRIKNKELKVASEKLSIKMQNYVVKKLNNKFFCRYEVSNYASFEASKNIDYSCKHNLKYWNLEDYLGLGLASHSLVNNERFSNTENLKTYIDSLNKNILPRENKKALTTNDIKIEFIMLGLRLTKGINLKEYKKRFIKDLLKEKEKDISQLLIAGLIELTENNQFLKATNKGFHLLNYIISCLTP